MSSSEESEPDLLIQIIQINQATSGVKYPLSSLYLKATLFQIYVKLLTCSSESYLSLSRFSQLIVSNQKLSRILSIENLQTSNYSLSAFIKFSLRLRFEFEPTSLNRTLKLQRGFFQQILWMKMLKFQESQVWSPNAIIIFSISILKFRGNLSDSGILPVSSMIQSQRYMPGYLDLRMFQLKEFFSSLIFSFWTYLSQGVDYAISQQMQSNCQCGGKVFQTEGEMVCHSCGKVSSSLMFGNYFTFTDFKLDGTNIDMNNVQGKFAKNNQEDITTRRLKKAQEEIVKLSRQLQLDDHERDHAKDYSLRVIKLADRENFFNKGKNIRIYAAAALYIALRLDSAPYMLVDFSDKMGQNLFKLARSYLKLVQCLKLQSQLPLLEPIIFIVKYCRNLNFGQKAKQIRDTAIKLVQRMERDWMCQGRRPSSICGAAILIASKCHGVPCTLGQISKTVYVCQQTIRRRLDQFKQTPIARLTTQQFKQMKNLNDIGQQMDPPAFSRNRLKSKIEKSQSQNISEEIKLSAKIFQKSLLSEQSPVISEFGLLDEPSKCFQKELKEDEISDSQIQCFILSPQEKVIKTKIWEELNKDWLRKQSIKSMTANPVVTDKPKRIKKKMQKFETAEEAIKSTRMGARCTQLEIKEMLKPRKREFSQIVDLPMTANYDPFAFQFN